MSAQTGDTLHSSEGTTHKGHNVNDVSMMWKLYHKTNTNMIIYCMFTTLGNLQRMSIVFELYNIIAIVVSHYTEEEIRSREVTRCATSWYFQDFNLLSPNLVFFPLPQMNPHCFLQCEQFLFFLFLFFHQYEHFWRTDSKSWKLGGYT